MERVIVSCLGSRERYGLPVALQKTGKLQRFYTDIYVPSILNKFSTFGPKGLKALLSRYHPDLPYVKVSSQFLLGLSFRKKIRLANTLAQKQHLLLKYGQKYAQNVADVMPDTKCFVGFTGASLETFQYCKRHGIYTILDQVDPAKCEWELVAKEFFKYPGWERGDGDVRWSREFEDRVREELLMADEVIVNSPYSQRSIQSWLARDQVSVLPIASSIQRKEKKMFNKSTPLKALFLGSLCLRKGVHFALMAVDRLVKNGYEIELILAGPNMIFPDKLNEYSGCRYLGVLPGNEISALLDTCDVLVFPTLSEGFGMVQIEAMSRGLPVISTRNAAEIVEHDKSGFVVNVSDLDGLFEALKRYCEDRFLLERHSKNAYERAGDFIPAVYEQKVNNFFESI